MMPLERYAEVLAHLAFFKKSSPAEVRERMGVDGTEWRAAEKHWPAELSEGSGESVATFSSAFLAAKQRLTAAKPTLESLGPRRQQFNNVDATAIGALAPIEDPLPFSEESSVEVRRRLQQPTSGSQRLGGETTASNALHPAVGETLPFLDARSLAASEGAADRLTLEQYAMMRAELATYPHQVDQVANRYGLGDSYTRELVEEDWRRRIAADTSIRTRFSTIFESHRAWLSGNKR